MEKSSPSREKRDRKCSSRNFEQCTTESRSRQPETGCRYGLSLSNRISGVRDRGNSDYDLTSGLEPCDKPRTLPVIRSADLNPAHLPGLQVPGLYVHIPFCFHKCHYCDFYSITRQGV